MHVPTHERWDPLLIQANYTFVQFDGCDRWYVANEKPDRMPPFQYRSDNYVQHSYPRRIEQLEARNRQLEEALDQAKQALSAI